MKLENILTRLKEQSDPKAVAGMARFGINPRSALGISEEATKKGESVILSVQMIPGGGLWETS